MVIPPAALKTMAVQSMAGYLPGRGELIIEGLLWMMSRSPRIPLPEINSHEHCRVLVNDRVAIFLLNCLDFKDRDLQVNNLNP
jgi:hypothetical protein